MKKDQLPAEQPSLVEPRECSMSFDPMKPGVFLQRDNRFRVQVKLGDIQVSAHLPNPGRLRELLVPGRRVWLTPARNPKRRTAYDLSLIDYQGELVSLNSQLPNALIAEALRLRVLPGFEHYVGFRREVSIGKSRIDFCLEDDDGICWLEVKSVTLVEQGIAAFPDAPTLRGQRHLRELMARVAEGDRAAVFFVVQRSDALAFRPHDVTDPAFGALLRQAVALGIEVRALRCLVTHEAIVIKDQIPLRL